MSPPSPRSSDPDAHAAVGDDPLLEAVFPLVAGWCARLGGGRIDVEQAVHDVLLLVLRRAGDRRPDVPIEAWAYGIARGVVANHRRRAWLRRWLPGAPVEAVTTHTPLLDVERLETARRVAALLDRLSATHREVLVLCDVEERTAAEVAVLLQIPEGTVRSRLRLARERFRALAPAYHLHPPDGGSP